MIFVHIMLENELNNSIPERENEIMIRQSLEINFEWKIQDIRT